MFGNNFDVLPPDAGPRGGGPLGASSAPPLPREESVATELALDAVILEDGRCLGTDESGLFASVAEAVERQRSTAREIIAALDQGAPEGRIFELLAPLARRQTQSRQLAPLLAMFGNMAIHRLINASPTELRTWLGQLAESVPLPLKIDGQRGVDLR
jgi:hypothetical protein